MYKNYLYIYIKVLFMSHSIIVREEPMINHGIQSASTMIPRSSHEYNLNDSVE